MSGGEQQMLAIGRCLMGLPELIMFDEPSLGLAPLVVQEMFRTIRLLNQARASRSCWSSRTSRRRSSWRARLRARERPHRHAGRGEDLLHDDRVRQAYLGI